MRVSTCKYKGSCRHPSLPFVSSWLLTGALSAPSVGRCEDASSLLVWSPQEQLSPLVIFFCREFFGQWLIYCPFPFAPYSLLGGVSLAEVALHLPQGPLAPAGWASTPLLTASPAQSRAPRTCTRATAGLHQALHPVPYAGLCR